MMVYWAVRICTRESTGCLGIKTLIFKSHYKTSGLVIVCPKEEKEKFTGCGDEDVGSEKNVEGKKYQETHFYDNQVF